MDDRVEIENLKKLADKWYDDATRCGDDMMADGFNSCADELLGLLDKIHKEDTSEEV